ncbi:MAG: peptidylprolyl isomerase, partial [Bdellovibrionota bacterium]
LGAMKAEVDFVRIPSDSLVIPESIPQADVKAYIAKPENEAKLKAAYEARKEEFSTAETVRARHILVKAEEGDAAAEKKALEKIKTIVEKAKTEDFAKLASQFSDDPGSKAKGGDLGFFPKGKMVEEFDDAAFTQALGEVGDPVKSQFGYHIIKVEDKKPASSRSYEEARDDLASQELARERSQAAVEALEGALRQGDTGVVSKFVEANKLKWEESGAFSIESETIPKMNAGDDAIRAAFSLTPAKPLADRLVRQGPVAFVMRHKPVQAVKPDPSKDANSALLSDFMANRRSEDALRLWMDSLKKTARISYQGNTGNASNQ